MSNEFAPTKNQLGIDVKYESQELDNDTWAQNMLREIGKTMAVSGHEYKGSIAMHIHVTELGKQIAFVEQFAAGELPEAVLMNAYQTLGIHLAKRFGHKMSTTNTKDKR